MKKEEWFLEYVELNEIEKAKNMLEKGEVDINVINDYKENALLLALGNGEKEFAEYLVEKGINLNQKNDGKETAIMLACREGFNDLAKKMIKKGANINIDNDFGETPIAIAASTSRNDVLETLIVGGAKLNITERMNGYTPLIMTVYNQNVEGCKLLLEGGAKATIRSTCDQSVLDFFVQSVHNEENKKTFLRLFYTHRKSFDEKDRENIKRMWYQYMD